MAYVNEAVADSGAKICVRTDGSTGHMGVPGYGNMKTLPDADKQSFLQAIREGKADEVRVTLNDPKDVNAGYTIWDGKGGFYNFHPGM